MTLIGLSIFRLAQIWWENKCYIWNWVSF